MTGPALIEQTRPRPAHTTAGEAHAPGPEQVPRLEESPFGSPDAVLQLQRSVGNRAVNQFLTRPPARPPRPAKPAIRPEVTRERAPAAMAVAAESLGLEPITSSETADPVHAMLSGGAAAPPLPPIPPVTPPPGSDATGIRIDRYTPPALGPIPPGDMLDGVDVGEVPTTAPEGIDSSGAATSAMNAQAAGVESASPSGSWTDAAMQAALGLLRSLFSQATGAARGVASSVGGIVTGALASVGGTVRGLVGGLGGAVAAAVGAAKSAATAVFTSVTGGLKGALGGAYAMVRGFLAGTAGGLRGLAETLSSQREETDIAGRLRAFVPRLLAEMPGRIRAMVQGLQDRMAGVVTTMVGGLQSLVTSAISALMRGIQVVRDALMAAVTRIASAISGVVDRVVAAARRLPALVSAMTNRIVNAVRGAIRKITKVARDIVKRALTAAVAALRKLRDVVVRVVKTAVRLMLQGIKAFGRFLLSALRAAIAFFKRLGSMLFRFVEDVIRWAQRTWAWMHLYEKEEYIFGGTRGPQTMVPPTGSGGFAAAYSPGAGRLTITLSGGVNFMPGIRLGGGRAIPVQPKAGAIRAANQINTLPPADRPAAVAAWQWGESDETDFLANFQSSVHDAWSGKHQFFYDEKYWDDLGATVDVQTSFHKGAKGPNENLSMTVYKVPPDFRGGVGVVRSKDRTSATDNEMVLNSNDVAPRNDNLLVRGVPNFSPGSAVLSAAASGSVATTAATFKSGGRCRICNETVEVRGPILTVSVQGDGPDPEALARQRFNAIRAALVAGGLTDPANRVIYAYGGVGVGASVSADGGVAQVVAAHEAGHAMGLGDEYNTGPGSAIKGTGKAAGGRASHDELAKEMGVPEGSVHENSDSIMSLGTTVLPQHYATFWWALKEVSGKDDWKLGAPRGPYTIPRPGPFPTPKW